MLMMTTATIYLTDDRVPRLVAAEMALTKALSLAPQHARAHVLLGNVKILTNRVAQGVAECEQALVLDRNLAVAHASIGSAKYFYGSRRGDRGPCPRGVPPFSPRYRGHCWMMFVGLAKFQLSAHAEAVAWLRRSIEANPNHPRVHFYLAAALALLGRLDEARAAVQAGLALDPTFTISRFRTNVPSDNPTSLIIDPKAGRPRWPRRGGTRLSRSLGRGACCFSHIQSGA